jgi:hypothetical protein
MLFCSMTFASAIALAVESKRAFNIPAEAAEQTLKQFAAQSGLEVLYSTQAAAGVRTKAVRGELTPETAIKQMLQGTPLFAVKDAKNGVLRIARNGSARSGKIEPFSPTPQTEEPQKKSNE